MQEDFYKNLFESTRCGILTLDQEGRVTTVNHLARSILDLPDTLAEKTPCQELLRDHPSLCRTLLDSLRMETPPSRFELDLKVPGRPKQVIGGSISHIRTANGTRSGVAFIFKDLTELEGKEEQDRLKERLAAIGQMAAGLAHEIRNPLGNIGTTASLLKRKMNGNESGIHKLESIIQEVGRLNQTVTQCLDYAKPVHVSQRPVDLLDLIRQALRDVQTMWPRNRVQVLEKLDERVRAVVGDRVQLGQVFRNLIANAFDAMEGKGVLEISSSFDAPEGHQGTQATALDEDPFPAQAVIRFRDTGPGIPPEVRERLFFPFFTTKPGGSGMGLAVARKIVESHQGIIDVESEPGQGATFTLKLPYRPSSETRPDGKGDR